MDVDAILRAAKWAGITTEQEAIERLAAYRAWLLEEALPAGGIGPDEADNLDVRHLADSLTLAWVWRDRRPGSIIDLGSGAGLPGIPLAICHPSIPFLLVDRSGRRCRLMRRAVRVLGLDNVDVLQTDIMHAAERADAVVGRAVVAAERIEALARPWLRDGGVAAFAASRTVPPRVPGLVTVEVPAGILDHSAWILIMGPLRQEDG